MVAGGRLEAGATPRARCAKVLHTLHRNQSPAQFMYAHIFLGPYRSPRAASQDSRETKTEHGQLRQRHT